MEFRILGPLEVVDDGQQVDLGGAKQRALLAVLHLHANEVVSTDALIYTLWEEEMPETGRKALQVSVSQLRKALGKDRLQTKAAGYMLRIEDAVKPEQSPATTRFRMRWSRPPRPPRPRRRESPRSPPTRGGIRRRRRGASPSPPAHPG
jgi:hypothetical protein